MSITFTTGPLEVNFSNSNAHALLLAMGIEPWPCGTMSGPEFNHRAWTALASDDLALASLVLPMIVEPRFISFGLDIQGIRDRLTRLASLGADHDITWS